VLARILLEIGNELGHRVDRDRGIDDQDVVGGADLDHRREIGLDPELGIGNERRDRGERSSDREQGVAVGRLLENLVGADRHHGTRLVLDDHVPAFAFGQGGGDDARQNVGGRARRSRHDDADDIGRKGLAQRRLTGGDADAQRRRARQE
jgi:hypothetical protein